MQGSSALRALVHMQYGTNQIGLYCKMPSPHREHEGEGDKDRDSKNRQREKEEEEYVESMRKEDTSQHEEGDTRSKR